MSGGDHQFGARKAPDPCASPPSDPGRTTLAFAVSLALAVAYSGSSGVAAANSSTTAAGGDGQVAEALRATNRAFKGTNRNVSPRTRPAVGGKHIVIISPGQASITAQVGVDAAVDAATAIGWEVEVYDAKLDPANYAPLVRQAVAAHVDGIILGAIDCQNVQAPLREARDAGIAVVGVGAFDCNDPHAGGAKHGLFSAQINFGSGIENAGAYAEAYGAAQADYIIAKSQNRARIVALQDPEFTTLYYTYRGFQAKDREVTRVEDREHTGDHHRRLHHEQTRSEDPGRTPASS